MGGQYTPKTGKYAGRVFPSYRQYLNTKSKDEGYENFSQRTEARKDVREFENEVGIEKSETRRLRNGNKIDIYQSDFLDELIDYAVLLAPNYVVSIIVKTYRSFGTSKMQRTKIGYSTLVNSTRVSMFKKMNENGTLADIIDTNLEDVDVIRAVLYVKR